MTSGCSRRRPSWKPGKTIEHGDFLSTYRHAGGPHEFMQTGNGAQPYDLIVRIEKVKSGRWTLLLSAAEAVAAGMNPEHEGEVTFPPGSRFKITKPLNVDPARASTNDKDKAYCETTWEEITPAQAAPQGAPAPTVGDDKVPDACSSRSRRWRSGWAPRNRPPTSRSLPPTSRSRPIRGPARAKAVAAVPADVQAQVAVIVAPPDINALVADVHDVKLPEPTEDVDTLVGVNADEKQ